MLNYRVDEMQMKWNVCVGKSWHWKCVLTLAWHT